MWGRQCYRYSDIDFKSASRDGFGIDWPLASADLAPYYDLVERYVGISGINEGIPQLPDQQLQPPMGLVRRVARAHDASGPRIGTHRHAGADGQPDQSINGRPACHLCGPCERGCAHLLVLQCGVHDDADAEKTGRCRIVTGAMAAEVLMDPQTHRRETGIRYVDRRTRDRPRGHGRVVVARGAGVRVGADAVQLGDGAGSGRTGQLEWRVGEATS